MAWGAPVNLRVPHGDRPEVDVDLIVPNHAENPFVLIGTVGVNPNHLPANQVVEIVPCFFAKGLAGLSIMGDLGGFNAEEADTELRAVVRDGGKLLNFGIWFCCKSFLKFWLVKSSSGN